VVFDYSPDMVFYLAGADPYEGDRLGRLKLTINGLQQRDALVFTRCRDANVPTVVTMSGGYAHDIDAIVTIHANTIRAATALTSRAAPGAPAAPCPPLPPVSP
jgi:acetoin utilization deacetylase AcuC-like enzyme